MKKTVLITGGAVRLGRGITDYFLEKGWNVAVHYHQSTEQARELSERENVYLYQADLSSTSGRNDLVESIKNQFEALHGLVNNAAIFWESDLNNIRSDDWEIPMEINARAPFELSRRLRPMLSPVNGSIVQILDAALDRPYKDYLPYFASKGALKNLTRGLARALGPNVRVNAVGPGPIEFPPDTAEKEIQKIIQKTVLERQGTREEIAEAVFFLLARATYTTGEFLRVDGGRSLN